MSDGVDVGDVVTLSIRYLNQVPHGELSIKYRKPGDLAPTIKVWGTGPEIGEELVVVDGVNQYRYFIDLNIDKDSWWTWRWYSTGLNQAAEEGAFQVKSSFFT